MIRKPILASPLNTKDEKQLWQIQQHLPLLCSFKIDGVRAVADRGTLLSRSMKPIKNIYVRTILSDKRLAGLDGELVLGDPFDPMCFRKTSSAVNSIQGKPNISWYVFDNCNDKFIDAPFIQRSKSIANLPGAFPMVKRIHQELCLTWDQVLAYEAKALDFGYEGLIMRRLDGRYKEGRSTLREGLAVKLKRFEDSEAYVIGVVELMHNNNESVVSEDGSSKRSSHKANKERSGLMGALVVRDVHSGVSFEIGTGFTEEDRAWWWNYRDTAEGRLVKYKFFPVGKYDKPRHPSFIGLRDEEDMD